MQHSGADLEHGITFLLEGRLESKAAAYRFLEAAGAHLPNIDVSELMQQVKPEFNLDLKIINIWHVQGEIMQRRSCVLNGGIFNI